MDIYTYLKNDHQRISQLLNEVMLAESPGDREECFEQVKQALQLHAESEEETFYAALEKEESTEERIEDAEDDHDEMNELMRRLTRMSAQSDKWMELFGEFKHAVEHHVRDEEGRIFSKARQILNAGEAERLGKEMEHLKEEALEDVA